MKLKMKEKFAAIESDSVNELYCICHQIVTGRDALLIHSNETLPDMRNELEGVPLNWHYRDYVLRILSDVVCKRW